MKVTKILARNKFKQPNKVEETLPVSVVKLFFLCFYAMFGQYSTLPCIFQSTCFGLARKPG